MIIFAILAAAALDAPQTSPATAPPSGALVAASPAPTAPNHSQDGFQVGLDTIATVVSRLGKPNSTSVMSDGTQIVIYISNHTHVKATSFIPIVGIFASGAKGTMSIKTFTFGSDGILKSFTSNDSNSNCDIGIAGGGCR